MSDYNEIDTAALDRHITGNYGEDQFRGLIECPNCEGNGTVDETNEDYEGIDKCPRCGGDGHLEKEYLTDSGDDPDRKYDEARDREMLGIDVPDGGE